MDPNEIVSMQHITVEFPGVKALDDVSFSLRRGEVHILLGENGAGKSTLMKVLSGVYKRNAGTVRVDGQEVRFAGTRDAMNAGINIVHQELNLIPYLTVAENIFLGREPKKAGVIDWKRLYRDADEILRQLGVALRAKDMLGSLSVAQQQMVEIAKAVSQNSKVIILDEPTSSLTDREIESLFRIVLDLKARGVGVVYISHRFEEIKRIGDRATIMRDGRYIATVEVAEKTVDEMIGMMVGRELTELFPKTPVAIGETLLAVRGLSTRDKLRDCSFVARRGEILGIAGLMGAGRTELARAVIGADPASAGEVWLNGQKLTIRSPEDAVRHGIGLLPEDRKNHGLVLGMSVGENITLANVSTILRNGLISRKAERALGAQYVDQLRVKTPHLQQKVKFLSGGNQQKVVIAKWLTTEGQVLFFDEPTRGIDVGAKAEIYKIMCELAGRGMAVVMISSELPEVLGMSDRILVMCGGAIVCEMTRAEATQEKIMYYATGGGKDE
ncbi:sugar ABC transporter ATP-binding protein [Butyricicoccus faecihominis]|uniref:sugar ABC transporter ATP-binding protein n=1 Tax=Butyricicoccus faecihominis TaxID=1712515 RepID=UPI00247B2687|nr:sugar ABC transporter ATP-binding protein [Butyricicoccus faecihominis]MCQ5131232.1 sugar ABC transporter ATP-binding protein [Butyricicoccus faecihominis]